MYFLLFFFNDTATTEIYTLSLHDALPISPVVNDHPWWKLRWKPDGSKKSQKKRARTISNRTIHGRSEEHTSELQSRLHLVCRLLLEKKKNANHHLSQISTLAVVNSDIVDG